MSERNVVVSRVALLGNAAPRRCGIATFSDDLAEALRGTAPGAGVLRLAMTDRPEGYDYPPAVRFEIRAGVTCDYRRAADFLALQEIDVLCVQHEFGIFGGPAGATLLELLAGVRVPVVTTLHTVLARPDRAQREVMRALVARSDRLVVMSERGAAFLREIYEVPARRIEVIPHGIPDAPFLDPSFHKDELGLAEHRVMLTFGLLSRNKGIETAIRALPRVLERVPDLVYVVLGATHPQVRAQEGERYRDELRRLADELGVAERVRFEERFVTKEELLTWLSLADLYCTPYRQREQITSGTLAYAVGLGKAVVSTPYWHAEELLAHGRGALVPFDDPAALADRVSALLEDDAARNAMRKRAYLYGRGMTWPTVARRYLELFEDVKRARAAPPSPSQAAVPPVFDPRHLRRLSDHLGLLQHAALTVPLVEEGYTTDDNARALALVVKAGRLGVAPAAEMRELAGRYLAFLRFAWEPTLGRFRNFLGADRRWLEPCGSENAHGRALRALATVLVESEDAAHRALARRLFEEALPVTTGFTSPRAWAFALLATAAYLERLGGDRAAQRVGDVLAARLREALASASRPGWRWFEDHLAHSNAKLPHALIAWGRVRGDDDTVALGVEALRWLCREQSDTAGRFSPIGSDWVWQRDDPRPLFDQQPVEAYATVDACLEADRATGARRWRAEARRAFAWFLGDNGLGRPLYDPTTGGCRDGLHPDRVNENQGAESTLAFWLAALALHEAEARPAALPPARTAAAAED